MTAAEQYNLWSGLRAWPWDEKEIPRPRTPHPEPKTRGTVGDWLTEFEITIFPPAPEGWRLTQFYAEGNGMHGGHGRPLALTESLVLAYFHRTTARGATAILHRKRNANGPGRHAWRFVEGFRWEICTDIDCDYDGLHTVDIPPAAGAEEIKALLSEGTT